MSFSKSARASAKAQGGGGPSSGRRSENRELMQTLKGLSQVPALQISISASSGNGNDSRLHFRDSWHLGFIGDQFAQEWNQHDKRDTDCETAGAELGEKFRVAGVGGDRGVAARLGDHSRKVASKE